MTLFRPCIDLHEGKVKQIVGGTLSDHAQDLVTNFVSERPASWFAELYRQDSLRGGHVIQLGKGNEDAARAALGAYPGGLQIGGGISLDNAAQFLDWGASHVIVTSWLFCDDKLDMERLRALSAKVGPERLVLDLSCRRTEQGWNIATNRWQTVTPVSITPQTLDTLAAYCAEFLVHAADVEGLQRGMDEELIVYLATHSPISVTYAGGARDLADLERCAQISQGRIDLTIGSALDIFGGKGAAYADCVRFNQRHA
jgi:phosphoribosylformimino-5-aminoimidazole carboxamide ribotide isomerase